MRGKIPVSGMYETVEVGRVAESKREVDQANWLNVLDVVAAVRYYAAVDLFACCCVQHHIGLHVERSDSRPSDTSLRAYADRNLAWHLTHTHPPLPHLPAP